MGLRSRVIHKVAFANCQEPGCPFAWDDKSEELHEPTVGEAAVLETGHRVKVRRIRETVVYRWDGNKMDIGVSLPR